MNDDFELLYLQSPVGKGQENSPDDVEALDDRLRKVGAYNPPPEYADNPQRYTTEPMIESLERYQEQNRLKIDGVAKPGGPTERAINNRLLKKPRGAGLLYDPPSALAGTVGNGFENRRSDVAGVQRRLGALGYLPEDPFDMPRGFIDEVTTMGVRAFQRMKGLVEDGWLAPRGETERALEDAVADLARAKGREWFTYADRAGRAQQAWLKSLAAPPNAEPSVDETESGIDIVPVRTRPQIGIEGAPGSAPAPAQLPPSLQSRQPRLIEVPGYRPQPNFRNAESPPRDLELRNPGEPPIRSQMPPLRTRVPVGPPTRDTEPVSIGDLDRALRREPLPAPDRQKTYVPEPGSPLAIPIIDFNPFGRPGNPRTVEANRTLAKAIEEGCKDAMGKDAQVTHFAGPGSKNNGEKAVKGPEGRSYPDTETQIEYKGMTIRIFGDTYSPKVDGSPNAREKRQFAKLDRNADRYDRIYVRLPKPWMVGEEINPDRLKEFTRELCRELKQAMDEGRLGDGKDKLKLEKTFEELTKRKKAAREKPEAPASGPNQPRP